MAADKGNQPREENPRQGVGSFGTTPTADRKEQGDQERAIQRGRENNRSTGVSGRYQTPQIYGRGTGQLSPFSMMRRMAEDMDRLFDNFGLGRSAFGVLPTFDRDLDPWRDTSTGTLTGWTPQVETFRRGDKLVVRADLPGLKKEDVNVEIDDGVLRINGERREEHEENRDDYYRSERTYGQFYRAIPLPDGVDETHCDASFKDGVLEVTLPAPKQEEKKAKRIQVK